MQRINEDIKNNQFKQVYLLYGEEAYLRKQYKDKLRNVLAGNADNMNYSYFEGKDVNVESIIDLAETMPFLSDRRVLIIENSGLFKSANDAMNDYLKNIAESTYFVFVESDVDKRGRLYKTVSNQGCAVELGRQDVATLKRWIMGILKRESFNMSEGAMGAFLEKTGEDMENISKELEKLICYKYESKTIIKEDVEVICITRVTNKIFDMINAIAAKKQKEALDLYYDLLVLKEAPMRILFLIARQFNLLMQVKSLKKLGYGSRQIGEKVGLHSFIAGKYITQAEKFPSKTLRNAVAACVDSEEAVKTGRMNDVMSVELLIVEFSR